MANEQNPPSSSVYEIAAILLDQLAEVAWSKLGLRPDMMSGKIETNLEEAKVAIDIVAYLASTVDAQLDEDDKRRVQSLVRDLKINFVQKSQA